MALSSENLYVGLIVHFAAQKGRNTVPNTDPARLLLKPKTATYLALVGLGLRLLLQELSTCRRV